MTTAQDIQRLYIAYFNRPADPVGLAYWTNQVDVNKISIQSVANSFSVQPEYANTLGKLSSTEIVNALYVNLFGRAPEPAGLLYWAGQLTAGTQSVGKIALSIALGAQAADAAALNAKIDAATAFTAAVDTTPEILGYAGSASFALASEYIASVKDAATLATATVPGTLSTTVLDATSAALGQNYTLTTGLDTLVGTAGGDTFTGVYGTGDTLTVLDSIDGKGGRDVLNLSDLKVGGGSSLPAGLVVKNVETVNLQSIGDVTIDLTAGAFTGVTKFNVSASNGVVDVTAADSTAVSVANVATATTTVTGGSTQTINVADAVIASKAAGAVNVTSTNGLVTVSDGTTQTITSAGGVALSKATGAIVVTDTSATAGSTITGGTTVSLTSATTGSISVGGALTAPTGAVTISNTVTGTKGGATAGGTIGVTGGTTVSVTNTASQPLQTTAVANGTTTLGAVTVTGSSATTAVTVTQTPAATAANTVLAQAAVTETTSAVFTGLAIGDSLTVGNLTFTARVATTAAQTAAAFANLTAGATQGNSVLGTYFGAVSGFTSGPATSATVLFTSTGAGNVTDLAFAVTGAAVAPTVTTTQGVPVIAAAGRGGIVDGAVTIADANFGTKANSITSVTLDGYGAATVNSDALATLSLANSAAAVTVGNNTAATLGLTLNKVTSAVSIDGGTAGTYKTVNVTTTGAASTVALTASGATALNVSGTQAVDLTGSTLGALKTVTVAGTAGLTLIAGATVTSIDTSATTGTSEITSTNSTSYTGGAGVDRVTLTGAAPTKAISLGAGNDSLTLSATTASTAVALNGGDGVDTITFVSANAVTASGSSLFAAQVTGFEILGLTAAGATGAESVRVDTLGNYNSVTTGAAAALLTLDGFSSGGTLTLTSSVGAGSYVVSGSTFAAGTADVFNIGITGATAAGSVTAAGIETVNISAAAAGESLTLVATAAKTINVTGAGTLNLTTAANTAVTLIDASASTGAITVNAAGTVASTIRGGAGADVLTASNQADVLVGGAGNDTLIAGSGLGTLTGGAGRDTFVVTASNNLNSYTTITDLTAGDIIQFGPSTGVETFNAARVTLAATAVFQDYVNAAINNGGNASVNGSISWFQYGGDTYIVESLHNATTLRDFQNGSDLIIKLTGTIDLSATSLNTGTNLAGAGGTSLLFA